MHKPIQAQKHQWQTSAPLPTVHTFLEPHSIMAKIKKIINTHMQDALNTVSGIVHRFWRRVARNSGAANSISAGAAAPLST